MKGGVRSEFELQMNRALYFLEHGEKKPLPTSCETGVYTGFRLAAGFYRELHTPTAEACVATCKAEPAEARCGGD